METLETIKQIMAAAGFPHLLDNTFTFWKFADEEYMQSIVLNEDASIADAVTAIANKYYETGYNRGRAEVQYSIKQALSIPEPLFQSH
jgi:hypothetical protein